jgi:type I restriction-modification system DNA methylase subunit
MPVTSTSQKMKRLTGHAQALGCSNLIQLDSEPDVGQMEYLDLLPNKSIAMLLPDAVAEFQGRPLLYLVDGLDETGESRLEATHIQNLQALLANRSEHACLGVVKPGSLEVYPINLDRQILAEGNFKTVLISDPNAAVFFQSLATGSFELAGRPEHPDYVYKTIYELLIKASKDLAGSEGKTGRMYGLDVLSTMGRALFFRFLIDRRIVLPSEIDKISPAADDLKDAFSNAEKAAATSCWLDETFNGDLLPLVDGLASDISREQRLRAYRRFFRNAGNATGQHVFSHLQAILRGWKSVGGAAFQLSLDWNDFDFAHIPIGVLSQVYETFSRQWDEEHAQETSVYYTPRHIAKLLVEEAFAGLKDSAEAVVLDPACGAGVFLVLAFRHMVRRHWKKTGTRPDTRTIQQILYKQLRGFEVSESALRLSALSLYISAIEVNGTQRPPKSLKFPLPLRDEVLFNFGQHDADRKRGFVLGSLGANVPVSFNHQFDIVVTNPPWTRLRAGSEENKSGGIDKQSVAQMNEEFTAITRRALIARGLDKLARNYTNPDNNPDLPFLWRATEWAKPGGIIAMALPGRIILRQSGQGKAARDAIMCGLTVTGILNGSDLEKTAVWPSMDLPFMLLFARNSLPSAQHRFHFVTPLRENYLSSRGQFRLDYQAAETICAEDVVAQASLLKAIAVGTVLDVEIVERLANKGWEKLGEVWEELSLLSGDGYHIFPNDSQKPARDLFKLLDFERPEAGFSIEFSKLKTWGERYHRDTAHAPRTKKLFSAPVVIIPQTPGESRERPKSFLSLTTNIAFAQGNYGFSACGNSDGELLVSLLYLITHSQLFQHFCLIRSSRIGASYRTFIKEDLDAFPFPKPDQLTPKQKLRVLALARELETNTAKPWGEIDDFILALYGIDEHDATVISDTVTFAGPYRTVREPAERPVESEDIEIFRSYLQDMLQPLFQVTGQSIVVRVAPLASNEWNTPWHFISVSLTSDRLPNMQKMLAQLMAEANKTGASRITLRFPSGGLIIGILNQRRFWTRSRARLCSLYIEQQHLDAFPLPTL